MTAGHNALRGSGPGQFPAFDDAVATKFDKTIAAWPPLPEHAFVTYPKARRRYEQVIKRAGGPANCET
jgi:hypothetical protein